MGLNLGEELGVKGLTLAASNPSTALFRVFDYYPFSSILSFIAVLLLGTFFITSANSATFVLGMLSSEGDLNPSRQKQFIWGIVQALFAAALLISGGLNALQTASVAAAFPFIAVMLFAIVSLMVALREEK
jgi:glycine betaine transporter